MKPHQFKANSDVFSKNMKGRLYLMKSGTDYVFELNDAAAFIWSTLSRRTSVTQIGNHMVKRFDVSREDADHDITIFLNDLVREGFVDEYSS